MGDLWLQVIPVRASDAALLDNDITKKMVAEDSAAFAKIVERDPNNAARHEDLALIYLQTGRTNDAALQLREAIRLNPQSAPAHYNLGLALVQLQQLNDALREFNEAAALDPTLGEAHLNIGAILQATGKTDEALTHFQRATELRPDSAEAHSNLGRLLAMRRDDTAATAALERAVQLRPDLVSALTGLTWLRASSASGDLRDAAAAIRLGETAVTLTGNRDASALDALAAAYAAGGQFDRAITTARAALTLAASNRALALQIEARLSLYEEHKPFVAKP
jgi:tetratricopeptide (TPR) repeat protein